MPDMEIGCDTLSGNSCRQWYVYDWTNVALSEGVTALYETKKEALRKGRGMAQQTANKLGRPVTIDILSGQNHYQRTEEIEPTS